MENFDPDKKSEGLGDSIAKFTHAFGLDKLADKLAKAVGAEDCGCERRREVLNELFPYAVADIPEEEYVFMEGRLFEVTKQVMYGNANGVPVIYNPGEKVLIDPAHPLYQNLKQLLINKSLKRA